MKSRKQAGGAVAAVVERHRARLDEGADEARAEAEKRYLKSSREHLGCGVPVVRAQAKVLHRELGELAATELASLCRGLFETGVYELCLTAVLLLGHRARSLDEGAMPLFEELVRASGTWALVDTLCTEAIGVVVERHAEAAAVLDRWATDETFWVRRAAMLSLLVPIRKGGGDFERFCRYADAMLGEREFFIRKAIGWVLRDASRKRPALVIAFLEPRAARASGLTLREATRHLPEAEAERLLRLARAGEAPKAAGRKR